MDRPYGRRRRRRRTAVAACFFVFVLVVGCYLFMNLFIAILLEASPAVMRRRTRPRVRTRRPKSRPHRRRLSPRTASPSSRMERSARTAMPRARQRPVAPPARLGRPGQRTTRFCASAPRRRSALRARRPLSQNAVAPPRCTRPSGSEVAAPATGTRRNSKFRLLHHLPDCHIFNLPRA